MTTPLEELIARTAGPGRIVWIGLRPARRAEVVEIERARLAEAGLEGDRHSRPGKRALTLVQVEHLPVIAALARTERLGFSALRRNLAISGVNLLSLRGRRISLGTAEIEITGPCAPCSRMEEALGHGGYAAMRGHGGVTARVLAPGIIAIGNAVVPLDHPTQDDRSPA